MKRRNFLQAASLLSALITHAGSSFASAVLRYARPGSTGWPGASDWDGLRQAVGGRLIKLESPWSGSGPQQDSLKNPYYLRDQPALTQSLGWANAWSSAPSAYAVACESSADVAAAVLFARKHHLRLVVKGGGHSYQGTSSAPDSLLIWTRNMEKTALHEAFVAAGCTGQQAPATAVTIEAGAIWMHAYNAVTTQGGRYVQGGGCATVGVAGLIQSGGFGSHSKRYGLAAASLLEAEVVTADGAVRTVNPCSHPELFWALKGGGGGSFGVVTKVTLRTHELPASFGVAILRIKAASDEAYRRLIARFVAFYAQQLLNPHWGEQAVFRSDNVLALNLSFQGLSKEEAQAVWQPFLDWLAQSPQEYQLQAGPVILDIPARLMWNPKVLKSIPGAVKADSRPGAPDENVFWTDGEKEAGKFISGYQSAWVPATLLAPEQQGRLTDALYASSRQWEMALHFNKGLAGAPEEARQAARDTATNPLMVDAFALAICAAEQQRVHPELKEHRPDMELARKEAAAIERAMAALKAVIPLHGAYVSESDYFEKNWQRAYWGDNYPRLLAAKRQYDPHGLFNVHHGVGSELL